MDEPIRHLQLPLSDDVARSLRLGEIVTVTGPLFTGRSRFHIRAVEQDILPPIDFAQVNCFFHVGPVMRQWRGQWQAVSIEPTSSIRFERYAGQVVRRLGLRTLIGKTTMGPATAHALRQVGGVYLTKIGVCGSRLAPQVTKVSQVHFLDELGKTEATWVFEVDRFGPFFVGIDAEGNNYHKQLDARTRSNMACVHRELGIPDDFDYTDVSADRE